MKRLTEICNPKQWKTIPTNQLLSQGYPVYGANGIIGYYSEFNHKEPVLAITCRGATCGNVNITKPMSYITGNAMCLDDLDASVRIDFLYFALKHFDFSAVISGTAQPQITREGLKKVEIKVPSLENQKRISHTLDTIQFSIDIKRKELSELDELVKSKFVEMFGDISFNDKNWSVKGFTECAVIDGNMVNDFERYQDYPHIGIDSIEKETGELKGYRTIKEDNVISGKYLFTSNHIIYSKIRPNLNKVALPTFDGLCSADAYPILPISGVCSREYLAYVMRSECFLSYILMFSARANLPKVNRNQINGFSLPVPPLPLQEEFSSFVKNIDSLKSVVKKQISDLEELMNSKMDEYFS